MAIDLRAGVGAFRNALGVSEMSPVAQAEFDRLMAEKYPDVVNNLEKKGILSGDKSLDQHRAEILEYIASNYDLPTVYEQYRLQEQRVRRQNTTAIFVGVGLSLIAIAALAYFATKK